MPGAASSMPMSLSPWQPAQPSWPPGGCPCATAPARHIGNEAGMGIAQLFAIHIDRRFDHPLADRFSRRRLSCGSHMPSWLRMSGTRGGLTDLDRDGAAAGRHNRPRPRASPPPSSPWRNPPSAGHCACAVRRFCVCPSSCRATGAPDSRHSVPAILAFCGRPLPLGLWQPAQAVMPRAGSPAATSGRHGGMIAGIPVGRRACGSAPLIWPRVKWPLTPGRVNRVPSSVARSLHSAASVRHRPSRDRTAVPHARRQGSPAARTAAEISFFMAILPRPHASMTGIEAARQMPTGGTMRRACAWPP